MGFKTCTNCGEVWHTRDGFLGDWRVELIGYQPNFGDLEEGMFLFQHARPGCETTLAIEAGEFTDMYDGPIFEERKTGTAECRGYCRIESNLERCDRKCDCAYVREVIQKVRKWPKQAA